MRGRLAIAAGAAALVALPALAQDGGGDHETPDYPILLDGTLSGQGDLQDDEALHSGWLRFPGVMEPWEAFKADVAARTGIVFGGSWGVLYQNYSDVPAGAQRDSVGQKFTLNVSKQLLKAGTPDALTLDVVVEDRGPMGTDLPPLQAGLATGSIVPTAATWATSTSGSPRPTFARTSPGTASSTQSARSSRPTSSMPTRSSTTIASS